MHVELQADRSHYVTREPMVFMVSLTNETDDDMRIPDPLEFDNNMKHLFLEITGPDGMARFRRSQFRWATVFLNPDYEGEPLAPHHTIVSTIYPVVSFDVDTLTNSVVSGTFGLTCPEPGEYKVRVHYWDDQNHPLLWQSGDGSVASNEIRINIGEPTADERAILDAIWASGSAPLQIGDDQSALCDEEALRAAIADYPESRLAPLTRFYLARSLSSIRKWGSPIDEAHREAIAILEELREAHPRVRQKEVLLNLAVAHIRLDENERALEVLKAAFKAAPELKDNYSAMHLRLIADTSRSTRVDEWRKDRMRGSGEAHEQ
jgi:hypothetical protein